MSSPSWNKVFTENIRRNNPTYWGNWSLDTRIKPGAVGKISADSGSFEYQCILEDFSDSDTFEQLSSNKWAISSYDVKRTQNTLAASGAGIDPDTGTKVSGDIEVNWQFTGSEGIASEFSVAFTKGVKDPLSLVEAKKDWLLKQSQLTMRQKDGTIIPQGFGMITEVIYASSGLNIASAQQGSNFSITGSASAINKLVGADATGKASYEKSHVTGSVDSHMWPSEPNQEAEGMVPIAFKFLSFVGGVPVLGWKCFVDSLSFTFDNKHGGSYIAKCKLEYDNGEGKRVKEENKVPGGQKASITNIPVDASNMTLSVDFKASSSDISEENNNLLKWYSPYDEWESEKCRIEFRGMWPKKPSYKVVFDD